jgi:hypothetical protein
MPHAHWALIRGGVRNGDKWLALPCSFSHWQKICILLFVPLYSTEWVQHATAKQTATQSTTSNGRVASCSPLDDFFPGDSQITIIQPACSPSYFLTPTITPTFCMNYRSRGLPALSIRQAMTDGCCGNISEDLQIFCTTIKINTEHLRRNKSIYFTPLY